MKTTIGEKIIDISLRLLWAAVPASGAWALVSILNGPTWAGASFALIVFYMMLMEDRINEIKGSIDKH